MSPELVRQGARDDRRIARAAIFTVISSWKLLARFRNIFPPLPGYNVVARSVSWLGSAHRRSFRSLASVQGLCPDAEGPGQLTGGDDHDHYRQTPAGITPVRAAEYVRMSTEHQKYSTENQADAIRQYAERRGIEIVRTYADEGKSGLRLDGRDALKQLIDDVQSGAADFSTILVYDVSRWGRFQDADESAYYEYICKRAGISVHYCAEQFENDGSPVSTIVKSVKRAMAGEYSRELSAKVFAGQCRLIELGFRQGGPPATACAGS